MSSMQSTINHQLLSHAKKEIEFLSSCAKNTIYFNDDETLRRLTLSVTDMGTVKSWWLAGGLFNGDTQKGHYFLFWAIKSALNYNESTATTTKAAEEWKKELISTLKKAEQLINKTPEQYRHYFDTYRQETQADIFNDMTIFENDIQKEFMLSGVYETDTQKEKVISEQLMYLSCDPAGDIRRQRESLAVTAHQRGLTPLRTKGEAAKRTYFIRSLATSLNTITDNTTEIIYHFTRVLFVDDIQRNQIELLAKGIDTSSGEAIDPDYFENELYPALIENV